MADQRILPLHPDDSPVCPNRGYDGGPVHPVHAAEVAAADRLYAVTQQYEETAVDAETMEVIDRSSRAVSDTGKMRLYEIVIAPQERIVPGTYYRGAYLKCLTCGFVLPVVRETNQR